MCLCNRTQLLHRRRLQLSATFRPEHLQHRTCTELRYSMTSVVRASSEGGTVIPNALAVLRLMTRSYLVGACTGSSAGFAPFRILSTNVAAPLHWSTILGP